MNKNKILASLSISILLAACGSDSTTEKTTIELEPTSKTVSVIDGYITKATICVDRNINQICEPSEIAGETDNLGQFTILAEDAQYPVISQTTAGISSDSDSYGYATKSFEMLSNGDSTVITPFTTIAAKAGVSLDVLASTLNLNKDLISGDYISLKSSGNTNAIKAHAIARTLTSILPENLEKINPLTILIDATDYTIYIEDFITENGIEALDEVTINIINGLPSIKVLHKDLSEYLTADAWSFTSTNTSLFKSEGAMHIEFDTDEEDFSLYGQEGNLIATTPYLIDGNKLVSTNDVSEEFIATTESIAIVKTNMIGDMTIWSKKSLNFPIVTEVITTTSLENETFELIFDDSTSNSPQIKTVTLTFEELNGSPEGTVTLTENGESFSGSYYITPEDTIRDKLTNNNKVLMPINIILNDGTAFKYHLVTESNGLMVIYEQNRDNFSLFTKNKPLAKSILNKFSTK
jgi:hypothetical protein